MYAAKNMGKSLLYSFIFVTDSLRMHHHHHHITTSPRNKQPSAPSAVPSTAAPTVNPLMKTVGEGATALLMAQALLGASSNLIIQSASYTGGTVSSGIIYSFPDDHYLKTAFPQGAVVVTTGAATLALEVPNTGGNSGLSVGTSGDPNLPGQGFDASVLSISLKATTAGSFVFSYTFASEEYDEYVGAAYNDVFALLVDGVNVAKIPGTGAAVSINTVNSGQNANFYTSNPVGTA